MTTELRSDGYYVVFQEKTINGPFNSEQDANDYIAFLDELGD